MENLKICKKCNSEKSISEFTKNKNCKDGVEGTCKKCKNIYRKEKYKTLLKNNVLQKGTKICLKCNIEKNIAQFDLDFKMVTGRRNSCKSCDYKNKKLRQSKNKSLLNLSFWNNKANDLNKRHKKVKVSGKLLQKLYNNKCHYCEISLNTNFHIDHKTPLSRGGDNSIDNLVFCCEDCNHLKHTRTEKEFLEFIINYIKRFNS